MKSDFNNFINEKEEIDEKLNELLEQTKKLETVYQQKIENLEELEKSVLKSSFAGKL